jgi:imidazolonepropionase-like amidohydrolase
MNMLTVLRNCEVFDGHGEELKAGCSIVIEDDVICEVAEGDVTAADARIIDAGGRFVMPGLIDAHFHAYGAEANPALVDRLTPQLRAFHAGAILKGTLLRGYTTIRDAAGGDFSLWAAIERGLIQGPRLFYSGLALSQTGGHGDLRAADHYLEGAMCSCGYSGAMAKVVDGVDEMRREVREQLRQGATQIKLFISGGVLSPTDPFWMNQFTEGEIRAAVEEAQSRRTYVMAHAHTSEATMRCLRNGVRSIEHATAIDLETAQAIVAHDAFAVPTLAIIDAIKTAGPGLGLPAAMLQKMEEVSQHALGSIEYLKQAGAKIGFGTDLLGKMMSLQSKEFALRREVLSAIEILRSATSINADLLQMTGRLGTIAPGAFADILVVDGNPLQDIAILEQQDRLMMIMKGGSVVAPRLI